MIIDVRIDAEDEPRRYRVTREPDGIRVERQRDDGTDAAVLVDWRLPEPRVYSLILEGRSYDVHVDEHEDDEESLTLHLLSQVVHASAADARKHRVGKAAAGPDGAIRLTAPIPGRIVTVLASVGSRVERGDGILILEAMKMENEIKAPRAGTLTALEIAEGDGVEGGALLAVIE